jgi:oligosaccharide reducing-end xylanase
VRFARGLFAVALGAAAACSSTTDSIGHNGPGGIRLKPLVGPASYPNPFRDWLGKTDVEIASRLEAAFNQLFHGDPATQAIYFPDGDQASIRDLFHNDIRTEGVGWGMMVAVQMNKQDEFDHMWRFAKNDLQFATGPNKGYFTSSCDTESGTADCIDPFGMEQFLMALLFAHRRWSSGGAIDYGADAIALLDVIRHKQDQNGGIVDGVTDVFDATMRLPYDFPDETAAGRTRPSIVMPPYYELWAQATGDAFWSRAAESGRTLLKKSADPVTGLLPVRATFEGAAISGFASFQPEAYRALVTIALDEIWFGRDPWNVEESTRVLAFFTSKGFDSYGTSYNIKTGVALNPAREIALLIVNGMTAAASTAVDKEAYVQVVWDQPTPSGPVRYYQGIVDLLALLLLSGNYRVW